MSIVTLSHYLVDKIRMAGNFNFDRFVQVRIKFGRKIPQSFDSYCTLTYSLERHFPCDLERVGSSFSGWPNLQ